MRLAAVPLVLLALSFTLPAALAQEAPVPARCQAVGEVRFFWHYDCVEPEFRRLAALNPAIAKAYSIGSSVSGRPIWALEVANFEKRALDPQRPGFFLDSTHHGNEIQGTEGAMRLAKRLVEQYGKDAEATRWVDSFDIYIVPVVNPDGNLLDRRRNANDVDLNRNYPFEWCQRAIGCGPSAGSEPETKAIMAFMLGKPHLDAYVSLHTGTWDYVSPRCSKTEDRERAATSDEELYLRVFDELKATSGMGVRGASGTGESICWSYDVLEVFSILSEVTVEQDLLFSAEETRELDGAMKGITWLLDHTGRFGGSLKLELGPQAPLSVVIRNEGLGSTGAWRVELAGAVLAEGAALAPGAESIVPLPLSIAEAGATVRVAYDRVQVDSEASAPGQGRPRAPLVEELAVTAEQARAVAGGGSDAPGTLVMVALVAVGLAMVLLRRRA